MTKSFDKELYVKQDFIKKFLKTHEVYWKTKQISMEESLTNFINSILDDRLAILNNKCTTCDKRAVCKIWQNLIEKIKFTSEKYDELEFTAGMFKCDHYKKRGNK